jgi:hypothetical protein
VRDYIALGDKIVPPTRTAGQASFSKASLRSTFHRASHVRTAEFTDVLQLLGLPTRSKSYLMAQAGYEDERLNAYPK